MTDFNHAVIEEFRRNHGRVGGPFEGARLILLTTTGARSGRPHTVPLGYLPDGGDRLLVIGSAGGSPHHPQWYRNLLARPRATIEDGVFRYPAEALSLAGAERDAAFARAVEADPGWLTYQEQSGRTLPVIALIAAGQGPPEPMTGGSAGAMLVAAHDAFRRELALIRRDLLTPGSTVGAQLRIDCLTLCAGLGRHHAGEDQAIFPMLADRHPELGPAIERLTAEHAKVADLLEQLRQVLGENAADRDRLTAVVDRLITELEDHLRYEEEQLVTLLG
ncbi:nitroreductase/quinone reductase family protein [Microlunatus sp. GCM10028923]|uniref:nitroreductase/quinone reductase family protein n=1 Tax=Microlunatus sp. GCM10028923 TaxID=3273400 RepID=UPI003607E6E2